MSGAQLPNPFRPRNIGLCSFCVGLYMNLKPWVNLSQFLLIPANLTQVDGSRFRFPDWISMGCGDSEWSITVQTWYHWCTDLVISDTVHIRRSNNVKSYWEVQGFNFTPEKHENRFASLHYIASLFLFRKMPCLSQSECHVAPPPHPHPNSHLHMNLLHSTVPYNYIAGIDIGSWTLLLEAFFK